MAKTTETTDELIETTEETVEEIVMATDEAKAIIDKAMKKAIDSGKDKVEALKAVPPLALTARLLPGTDLTDEASFVQPVVEITPVINPLFHALMQNLDVKNLGQRSYRIPMGTKASMQKINATLDVLPGPIQYAMNQVADGDKNGYHHFAGKRYTVFGDLYFAWKETQIGGELEPKRTATMRAEHPTDGPLAGQVIIDKPSKDGKWMHLTICTNKLPGQDGLYFTDGPNAVDLHRFHSDTVKPAKVVTIDMAITILEEAAAQGWTIVDPTGDLKLLRDVLANLVIAQRVPGAPGEARLVVGNAIPTAKIDGADDALTGGTGAGRSVRANEVGAKTAADVIAAAKAAGFETIIDPHVTDVINMAKATPADFVVDDPDLQPRQYQREAVGLHLATTVGVLNCCSPGLGKTAQALWGMAGWAERNKAALSESA